MRDVQIVKGKKIREKSAFSRYAKIIRAKHFLRFIYIQLCLNREISVSRARDRSTTFYRQIFYVYTAIVEKNTHVDQDKSS